jgi:hypothetical protein
MTPAAKRCPRCTNVKPRDAFYERKTASGLSSWCQSCTRAYPDLPPDGPDRDADPLRAYLLNRRRAIHRREGGTELCTCGTCGREMARVDFGKFQWRNRNSSPPKCLRCVEAGKREKGLARYLAGVEAREARLSAEMAAQTRECARCKQNRTPGHYVAQQWRAKEPVCRRCDLDRDQAYRDEARRRG